MLFLQWIMSLSIGSILLSTYIGLNLFVLCETSHFFLHSKGNLCHALTFHNKLKLTGYLINLVTFLPPRVKLRVSISWPF